MDFLDDLRHQEEPEPQEKRPKSAPLIEPNTQDQNAWNELLGQVKLEEEVSPAQEKGRARRNAGKTGLTRGRKIILGVLALAAIGLWTLVVLVLTGSLHLPFTGRTSQVSVTPATDLQVAAAEEEVQVPTPTHAPPTETAVVPTAAPTTTPIPRGPLTTVYDERLRNDPTNVDLYLLRGQEFLNVGAFDAALLDFNTALQLDDQRAEAYAGVGWANYYVFRWESAAEAFDIAVALDEDLPGAHFGLGLIHYYRGSYRNAAREFDWAAEINPLHAEYEAWLAMAAAQLNDIAEAHGAATRAVELTQNESVVHVARSWARRIDVPSDFDGAQGDLLYAKNLAPNDFLALHAIAEFYLDNRPERLGEAEQLAVYALNWAANDVDEAIALHTLGKIYRQQGRQADALRVLEAAADLASREGDIALAGLAESLDATRD